MEVAIGLGAVIAALVPLWATWITVKGRSEIDYTRALEQRLRDASHDLAACRENTRALRDQIVELKNENLDLLRRLMRGNGS